MKNAEGYADIVIRDEREKIVSERPTVYSDEKIERIYEFEDGAILKYEFTLINLPSPNPHKFKPGVVKVIDYP
jgi:hypothetical protein